MDSNVARFDVSFGTAFLVYVEIILGSGTVAEWPPFGKKMLPQFTICCLCLFDVVFISHFWFRGPKWLCLFLVIAYLFFLQKLM